ncbi:MAG TPA: Gfo/Idh/MocA family oxidoreductase [Methylocella sp.]|nr:Gfo/Idh/MocA family oxidoreductase [Methylocella sp.]
MIGIGLIGYGYWGPNLMRNFSRQDGCKVHWVVGRRESRLDPLRSQYPGVKVSTHFDDVVTDQSVDAVVIATPVLSHYPLALRALEAGKHVLVEKPMTSTVDEGQRLVDEAKRRGLVLMVDHTFVYTPAVRRIRDLIQHGQIGDVLYYDSTRINLGLFQNDVNVLWDLAAHDLSILDYLIDDVPTAVSAVGKCLVPNAPESIAYLTLFFGGPAIAHINVNWLAPVKTRRVIIGGSRKMLVYDELEPSEKIKIYDKGIDMVETPEEGQMTRVNYRVGDMWAPALDSTEALHAMAAHFLDCIRNRKPAETSGEMGLRVVKLLEAANRSMRQNGQSINISHS